MSGIVIYKILPQTEWEEAQAEGVYRGSAHDARDGFMHFSTAAQLAETSRKYFSSVPDLVLLAVVTSALDGPPHPTLSPRGEGFLGLPSPLGEKDRMRGDSALRWEPSRGGDLFPHLYADLPVSAVTSARALPLGEDGIPLLPSDLSS